MHVKRTHFNGCRQIYSRYCKLIIKKNKHNRGATKHTKHEI